MSRYVIGRANALITFVLVALLTALGVLTWGQVSAIRDAQRWSDHTYDVLAAVGNLHLAIRQAESGQRGYLLTGNPEYLRPYEQALERVGFLEGQLQTLTAGSDRQQARLRELAPLVQKKLEELAQTIELRRQVGYAPALKLVDTDLGRRLMVDIESRLSTIAGEERQVLSGRRAAGAHDGVKLRILALAIAAIGILVLLVATRLLNRAYAGSAEKAAAQRALAVRLSTSLDSLSQGVAVFDRSLCLAHWNECFGQLLDLPRPTLRVGTPYGVFFELLGAPDNPFLEPERDLRELRPGDRTPVTFERVRETRHLEIRRTAMPGGGLVLTISDMTKRAEAEAVLRDAQKMEAIGHLTGGIAHDFNNLLTVVLGNLELIRGAATDAATLARVERAIWAAQHGATLTSQLLTFARKQPLAPQPIDPGQVIPALLPLLQRTLGEHIEIRFVDSPGLWPAMADAAQLESALLNLALNARDAMPGGGRLTIELANKVLDEDYARAHAEVTPGDYAMLAVSDTGHGMEPEVLARVFEPFFTTKPPGKGTGLGLPMVFGFAKQSAGHVKIYSEPGCGTTVRLYLPRAIGAAPAASRPRQTSGSAPRGSATILLVEDEAAVREVAGLILRDLGYRVLEAADGEEALRVIGAEGARPDLLLTDVVLPGRIRGRELAQRMLELRPDLPVLFMSGYTENAIVHGGRLDDGVHLISKPFKREVLARKVAELLGRPEASGDGNVIDLLSRK